MKLIIKNRIEGYYWAIEGTKLTNEARMQVKIESVNHHIDKDIAEMQGLRYLKKEGWA